MYLSLPGRVVRLGRRVPGAVARPAARALLRAALGPPVRSLPPAPHHVPAVPTFYCSEKVKPAAAGAPAHERTRFGETPHRRSPIGRDPPPPRPRPSGGRKPPLASRDNPGRAPPTARPGRSTSPALPTESRGIQATCRCCVLPPGRRLARLRAPVAHQCLMREVVVGEALGDRLGDLRGSAATAP